MFRTALIPLDDRPCNFEFPKVLAGLAGIEMVTPPKKSLNPIYRQKDSKSLYDWFTHTLPNVDVAIISLDQWVYGGLVPSRKSQISTEEALRSVRALKEIIHSFPKVKFYITNVLLRLSLTIDQTVSESDWKNIFQYSVLSDPEHPDPDRNLQLEALQKKISMKLLDEYLEVRKRNHRINLELLDIAPMISWAVFGQEDCAPWGLHRSECFELRTATEALPSNFGSRFHFVTGADELNALALMKAAMDWNKIAQKSISLATRVDDHESMERISAYEDISAQINLDLHFLPSPFLLTYLPSDSHFSSETPVLWIRGIPAGGQRDLCLPEAYTEIQKSNPTRNPFSKNEKDAALILNPLWRLRPGDYLLDLSCANGADSQFLESLSQRFPLKELGSFSAWNTTGNRIGTLVAHLALREISKSKGTWNPSIDRWWVFSQILDGYLYQSLVRPRLMALAKELGWDAWSLNPGAWDDLSQACDEEMHREIVNRLPDAAFKFRSRLPWPRLFEASFEPA